MALSSLYTVELYFHVVTMIILWPIYLGQHLALRFTHKKRLIPTKLYLILIGTVAMIIQTIRTVDPDAAFGRLNLPTEVSLYNQFGYFLMYGVILVVIATAKTLCTQIHRTVPTWFVYSIYGVNIVAHIFTTAVSIANGYWWAQKDQDHLMLAYKITVSTFTIESITILAIYFFLYVHLRKKIQEFLDQLLRQEAAKVQSHEQLQQQFIIAQSEQQQMLAPNPSPISSKPTNSPVILSVHVLPLPSTTKEEVGGHMNNSDDEVVVDEEQPKSDPRLTIEIPPTNPNALAVPASPIRNAPAPVALNPHDARYAPLYNAIRKMNILTILLALLLIGTLLSQVSTLITLSKGGIINDVVQSPRDDDGAYRMSGAIQAVVNQLSLFVVLWYSWTPPSKTWFPTHLRAHHLEFWSTLRHGVKDSHDHSRISTASDESRVSGEEAAVAASSVNATSKVQANVKRQKAAVVPINLDSQQPPFMRPTSPPLPSTLQSPTEVAISPKIVQSPPTTAPEVKDAW